MDVVVRKGYRTVLRAAVIRIDILERNAAKTIILSVPISRSNPACKEIGVALDLKYLGFKWTSRGLSRAAN